MTFIAFNCTINYNKKVKLSEIYHEFIVTLPETHIRIFSHTFCVKYYLRWNGADNKQNFSYSHCLILLNYIMYF